MSRRMLIDGTHSEEVCVVVMDGKRLDEYDVETSTKRQLKGNVYLAKVTRVEPSLQAAFVDFGGNRHGFLAFSEIHPDYYQIPIADREALLAEQESMELDARAAQEHVDEIDGGIIEAPEEDGDAQDSADANEEDETGEDETPELHAGADEMDDEDAAPAADAGPSGDDEAPDEAILESAPEAESEGDAGEAGATHMAEAADTGDSTSKRRPRPPRRYKIQEVIRRRQILLIQVVKEERGNKGAALTTYVSLAGRYCVLMPNTSRGGGISRKITNQASRRKLKEIHNDLDIQDGMGVILRTAGLERNKSEIKRDFEYLIRAWDEVRELTLRSSAPTLVYEEASLIKRAIRDLYERDMEEVLVEGAEAYQTAKKFMRLLMPSHAKKVQPYREAAIPLFQRFQVETQLDAIHVPEVKLPSGGSIVIQTTEALVSVDVNSGKSTGERNIEATAVKTNGEAADEIGRQLRLRDLAGLVVIDFIDMDERRNIRTVEKRLKDAMKGDRARIQLGRISNFGLLELSRQRLRPSLIEASTEICKHCKGTGFIRSTESTAVRVLRSIEEEGVRQRSSSITVGLPTSVALYILNQKRQVLTGIEARYGFQVFLAGDDTIIPPDMWMDRVKGVPAAVASSAINIEDIVAGTPDLDADEDAEDEAAAAAETSSEEENQEESGRSRPRRRRSRRKAADVETVVAADAEPADAADSQGEDGEEPRRPRRRRTRRKTSDEVVAGAEAESATEAGTGETVDAAAADAQGEGDDEGEQRPRRKRRGRRGGRRRSRSSEAGTETGLEAAEQPDLDTVPLEWIGSSAPAADAANGSRDEAPAQETAAEDVPAAEFEPADTDDEFVEATIVDLPMAEDDTPADDESGPLAEIAAAADAAKSSGADEPKRRGWWQRFGE